MKYGLITLDDAILFVSHVQEHLDHGWQLYGPTQVIYVPGQGAVYSQALTKIL